MSPAAACIFVVCALTLVNIVFLVGVAASPSVTSSGSDSWIDFCRRTVTVPRLFPMFTWAALCSFAPSSLRSSTQPQARTTDSSSVASWSRYGEGGVIVCTTSIITSEDAYCTDIAREGSAART